MYTTIGARPTGHAAERNVPAGPGRNRADILPAVASWGAPLIAVLVEAVVELPGGRWASRPDALTQHLHTKEEDRMTQAAKPNPIPDSYRRVTPSLTVQGGVKVLEF
jgi:hypothetical protein